MPTCASKILLDCTIDYYICANFEMDSCHITMQIMQEALAKIITLTSNLPIPMQ